MQFLSFGLIFRALLLVAGIWWCKEIFSRLPEDLAEMRDKNADPIKKAVNIALWLLTLLILYLIASFIWTLLQNILQSKHA